MKQKLHTFISSGKTKEGIEALLRYTQQIKHQDLHQEVIIQSSRYEEWRKGQRLGTATSQESEAALAKINVALLGIIDQLPGESLGSTPFPKRKKIEQSPTGRWWNWVVGLGLLIAIPAGIAEFSGYSIRDLLSFSPSIASDAITVVVKSQNNIPLPPKGKVYLNYGTARIGKELNNNREAIFTEVPAGYFEKGNHVKITFDDPQNEPYYAVYEDSIYQLAPHLTIELLVALRGLDQLYGIIKDYKTGDYVDSVRVSVLNLETFSNKNGYWELSIKDQDKRKKFHTLRASKTGYENWEQANIPAQTDQEISILLKPK
ncbi:MAG: hypothetical protein AAFP19_15030 [Bacteroidota bacterium]